MNDLFGQPLSARDLGRRVGDLRQLAGVEPFELLDGGQRGVRAVHLYNAAGLDCEILAERGLGIGRLAFRGVPLAYLSPVGALHPAYAESRPLDWLRLFPGGFLTPCGLTNVGSPCEDEGDALGLHGRLAALPAYQLRCGAEWVEGEYTLWVEGELRETTVFGPNLALRRRISTRLDTPALWIDDRVENRGFRREPHMFLQHINLGYPLVDAAARLELPERRTEPRDDAARPGVERCCEFEAPTPGYAEQVFYHDLAPDANGMVTARLVNPGLGGANGLGVSLRYNKSEYPVLVEWKMMGEGVYVVGLEPANCHVEGRRQERQRGTLQFLEPDESRSFSLEIRFEA
jgi:hypothetical protein